MRLGRQRKKRQCWAICSVRFGHDRRRVCTTKNNHLPRRNVPRSPQLPLPRARESVDQRLSSTVDLLRTLAIALSGTRYLILLHQAAWCQAHGVPDCRRLYQWGPLTIHKHDKVEQQRGYPCTEREEKSTISPLHKQNRTRSKVGVPDSTDRRSYFTKRPPAKMQSKIVQAASVHHTCTKRLFNRYFVNGRYTRNVLAFEVTSYCIRQMDQHRGCRVTFW